jgi:hypothetical protein
MISSANRSSRSTNSNKTINHSLSPFTRDFLSSRSRFTQKVGDKRRFMFSWFGLKAVESETSETIVAAPSGNCLEESYFCDFVSMLILGLS